MGCELNEPVPDMVQWQMFAANNKEFMKLQNKHSQSTTGLCLC